MQTNITFNNPTPLYLQNYTDLLEFAYKVQFSLNLLLETDDVILVT